MRRKNANNDDSKQIDSERIPGFKNFTEKEIGKNANKVNLLKKQKKQGKSKTHFEVGNLPLLKKAIEKLKGGYQVKFSSVNWAEGDIEIEIHCDAGQILTKTGSRAQLGVCGFIRSKINEK